MDVVAHAATYVVIVLPALQVHLNHLPPLVHLVVHLAQIVDVTIAYAVLNAILFHANVALNAQAILVNVVLCAILIHVNAAQCV